MNRFSIVTTSLFGLIAARCRALCADERLDKTPGYAGASRAGVK